MKKQDAVFIACEHSGTIRDKCLDNGILAFSCDLLDGEGKLFKTRIVKPVKGSAMHKLPPTKDRWKLRSKTYDGISEAIVNQWIKPVMKVII